MNLGEVIVTVAATAAATIAVVAAKMNLGSMKRSEVFLKLD